MTRAIGIHSSKRFLYSTYGVVVSPNWNCQS